MNKEKNPKRVEGGKKSVEARKLKEELNRKETELLRKENFELKQKALNETVPQITKEKEIPKERNFIQLFFLSIGICGLGLFIYSQKNPKIQEVQEVKEVKEVKEVNRNEKDQKEKDPFDF